MDCFEKRGVDFRVGNQMYGVIFGGYTYLAHHISILFKFRLGVKRVPQKAPPNPPWMFPIPFPPATGIGTLETLGVAVMAIGMATVPVDFGPGSTNGFSGWWIRKPT